MNILHCQTSLNKHWEKKTGLDFKEIIFKTNKTIRFQPDIIENKLENVHRIGFQMINSIESLKRKKNDDLFD
jgi:hypothetical protein